MLNHWLQQQWGPLPVPVWVLLALVAGLLRWLVVAGGAWMLGYRWRVQLPGLAKLQPAWPSHRQVQREVNDSVFSVLIISVLAVAPFLAGQAGTQALLHRVLPGNLGIHLLGLLLAVVVFDAHFYAIHRALHSRWLFRRVHRQHHLSHNPSPWAALAFHPAEAVMIGLPLLYWPLVWPMPGWAQALWGSFVLLQAVWAHSGFVFRLPGWLSRGLNLWYLGSEAHNRHHQRPQQQYGFCFTWCDALFGGTKSDESMNIPQIPTNEAEDPV